MSKVQKLRSLVNQQLTAAVQEISGLFEKTIAEISGLFEKTIAEYEEELCLTKQENERQRKLLDAVLNPEERLHRAVFPQQVLVSKEAVPHEQQEWRSSLDEGEPERPHIKEKKAELPFIPVPEKNEDDKEKAQSSQGNGKNCGVSEPARNLDPVSDLQLTCDGQSLFLHSSESETEDSDDWNETEEPQSGISILNELLSHGGPNVGEKPSSCNTKNNTARRLWTCSVCGEKLTSHRNRHMMIHTGEKPFSCSVCDQCFTRKQNLKKHMMVHTEERPFSCSTCDKCFKGKQNLKKHMVVHTEERPFSCSACDKSFKRKRNVKRHMMTHGGEKPFSCLVCGKRYTRKQQVQKHMRKIHTENI